MSALNRKFNRWSIFTIKIYPFSLSFIIFGSPLTPKNFFTFLPDNLTKSIRSTPKVLVKELRKKITTKWSTKFLIYQLPTQSCPQNKKKKSKKKTNLNPQKKSFPSFPKEIAFEIFSRISGNKITSDSTSVNWNPTKKTLLWSAHRTFKMKASKKWKLQKMRKAFKTLDPKRSASVRKGKYKRIR